MIEDKKNGVFCLKTFLVHGDFKNMHSDFDIFDEIEKYHIRREKNKADESKYTNGESDGRIKPPPDIEMPNFPKFADPLLDEAYKFGKEDELLKLMRDTLWEIREFEMELDNSLKQLNIKFDTKEYQI